MWRCYNEWMLQDMQETVLRLIRTADQLVHSDHYDAESVKQRLKTVDEKSENFMVALDNRRRNLSLAVTFFLLAKTVRPGHTWLIHIMHDLLMSRVTDLHYA